MISINRILCPIDMSSQSAGAVRYAVALARAHEAELILLHCTDAINARQDVEAFVKEYIGPSDWPRPAKVPMTMSSETIDD